MATSGTAFLAECHDSYRLRMARQPKHFTITSVSVEPLEPSGYLLVGPDRAVPSRFEASFQLARPEAAVTMEVFVGADQRPAVIELTIRSKVRAPITTSMLRSVLVDQLLQAAMAEAAVPASARDEWLATLPPGLANPADASWPSSAAAGSSASGNAEEDARTAARIYREALATGSRAPAVAVANTMNRSRAQVARYIRRARETGLLPALNRPQVDGKEQ